MTSETLTHAYINLPKYSTNSHQKPKVRASQIFKVDHHGHLSKYQHHWQEEDAGVNIVVKGERPDIPIYCRENLFSEDSIERNKERWENTKDCAQHRETARDIFLKDPQVESTKNNSAARDGRKRGLLAKHKVGQEDIEDCWEAPTNAIVSSTLNITDEDEEVPANVVEGDSDMLETEIIQGYHGDKDNRER